MNRDAEEGERVSVDAETIVEAAKDGPLSRLWQCDSKKLIRRATKKANVTAFCRCGASANKPFCDGSHKKVEFKAD
jgi:CDGSH-type Zn-finger protein